MKWNGSRYQFYYYGKILSHLSKIEKVTYVNALSLALKIASFNTALSVQNFRAAMAVPAALGLDPTIANAGTAPKSYIQIHHVAILIFTR